MKLRKKVLTALGIILPSVCAGAAPVVPQFSDENQEHWYYIVFKAGDAVLGDQGAPSRLVTRIADKSRENQLWKLVGDKDNFIIVNKTGTYVNCTDYVRSTANKEEAKSFRLVPSPISTMSDCWEIEYPGKGDEYNRWNQWGNTGAGVNIGLYTAGEPNNALTFLPQAELPTVHTLAKIKEFNVTPAASYTPEHRHTIWFGKPATAESVSDQWMEYGLPIGNGEFGAMMFGGVAQDRVQFNDKSLWTGDSKTRGCYQNFGDLYIEDVSGVFGNTAETAVKDYVRGLDMEEARAFASYRSPDGKVEYTREYIASNPDKVVAIRLAASEAGKISVRLRLFNGVRLGMLAPVYRDGRISFDGNLGLVDFRAVVKPEVKGGTVVTNEDNIEIRNADEVVIYLAGATNFDQHSPTYITDASALAGEVESRISKAGAKGWDALLSDHVSDFSKYFGRVDFRIDAAANDRSAEAMVTNYNNRRANRTDPCNLMLEELYYAFGRYLLISSSRGMDTPANLQGIWNHSNSPAWQCDIHSNINVQMNYWPAESTNLSEMHLPYLNYIHSMVTEHGEWAEYARRSGQSRGWTCFTQNNIFGHSDYAENYVIANAWYTSHLWQHYLYTLDREFLKEKALPVMLGCTRFWMERLVKDADGKWVAPKEWSPEHGPAEEDATAHAQQILNELFKTMLQAIEVLGTDAGVDAAFVSELMDKYENLDKGLAIETYTGKWGESLNGINNGDPILREWKKSDYSVGEDGHRHQSHLMSLYPFAEISPESEWFVPAVNSLKLRGDVSTGWSLAWRIALYARALDAEHAYTIIKSALRHASSYGQSSGAGGIYYNLLDSHAPFQIDGNFGYTAGVTEMLLQSYGGKLRLLPALPSGWVSGHLNGVKGEGNFEIDQTWKSGQLTEAVVKSGAGLECKLNYPGISKATLLDSKGAEVKFEKVDDNNISFATQKGESYVLSMPAVSSVGEVAGDAFAIRVEGGKAFVNDASASMRVYDINGMMVAASQSPEVSLSDIDKGLVIIEAVGDKGTAVKKIIVE